MIDALADTIVVAVVGLAVAGAIVALILDWEQEWRS